MLTCSISKPGRPPLGMVVEHAHLVFSSAFKSTNLTFVHIDKSIL